MRRILITGGNEGIGFFMAKALLERGDYVAVLDINTSNLQTLRAQYNDAVLIYAGDVRIASDVERCVQAAVQRWGALEYAVHNACLCPFLDFTHTTSEVYRQTSDVNFHGAVNLARAALPVLQAQHNGRIFFVSSGVGITGFVNISAYAASKGALESLAKCLNIEYQNSGITFHILHPPLTRTSSSSPLPIPHEFMADPEEVGRGLAKHLDQNRFIICHSFALRLQTRMAYLFPLPLGRLMSKMTANSAQSAEQNKGN